MQNLPRCYFASPYGFSEMTRRSYYEWYLPRFVDLVQIVDPWVAPLPKGWDSKDQSMVSAAWLELGEYHLRTIESCDLMIAALDQEPCDNGTVIEVAHASARGIPVIGYRNDSRSNGEPGLPYNLMIGASIRRSGGFEATNVDEIITRLPSFLAGIK